MEAIEFISTVEGGIIKIPQQYKGTLTKKVRVIILVEEQSAVKKSTKKRDFTAFKTKTKNLVSSLRSS